jgi:hypothetical protein
MNSALGNQAQQGNVDRVRSIGYATAPSGEPSPSPDTVPPLHEACTVLHGSILDLEHVVSALEKRLARVVYPVPPQEKNENGLSVRENSYVAEVHDATSRVLGIHGRIDSLLNRLHV